MVTPTLVLDGSDFALRAPVEGRWQVGVDRGLEHSLLEVERIGHIHSVIAQHWLVLFGSLFRIKVLIVNRVQHFTHPIGELIDSDFVRDEAFLVLLVMRFDEQKILQEIEFSRLFFVVGWKMSVELDLRLDSS